MQNYSSYYEGSEPAEQGTSYGGYDPNDTTSQASPSRPVPFTYKVQEVGEQGSLSGGNDATFLPPAYPYQPHHLHAQQQHQQHQQQHQYSYHPFYQAGPPSAATSSSNTSSMSSSNTLSPMSTSTLNRSHRGSTPSTIHTPITPLDLTSPTGHGPKETSEHNPWFASMQDAYLANRPPQHDDYRQQLTSGHAPQRPSRAMKRSSLSAPIVPGVASVRNSPNHPQQYLSVEGGVPNRRASVMSYQPPSMSPMPRPQRRLSMHSFGARPDSFGVIATAASTSGPSASQQSSMHQSPQQNRLAARNRLTLEVPRQTLPTIAQGPGASSQSGETSDVDRLFAEVFGGSPSSITSHPVPQVNPMHGNPSPTSPIRNHSQLQQMSPSQTAPYNGTPLSPGYTSPTSAVFPSLDGRPTPRTNYNIGGVLLDPEDLHMLGPDPLSPPHDQLYGQQAYQQMPAQSGWQSGFSLSGSIPSAQGSSSTMEPFNPSRSVTMAPAYPEEEVAATSAAPAAAGDWTYSFGSYNPGAGYMAPLHQTQMGSVIPERPASAPPAETPGGEALQAEIITQHLERRRGSSVDSAALMVFSSAANPSYSSLSSSQAAGYSLVAQDQLQKLLGQHPQQQQQPPSASIYGHSHPQQRLSASLQQISPAYLGPGPGKVSLAAPPTPSRRASMTSMPPAPSAMSPTSASPASRAPFTSPQPRNRRMPSTPAASVPPSSPSRGAPPSKSVSPTSGSRPAPAAPTRRYTPRAGKRGSGAPMFINFTSKDANKLLSGVAPSGSSKRKREEEEQARHAKVAKGSPTAQASSSQTSPPGQQDASGMGS